MTTSPPKSRLQERMLRLREDFIRQLPTRLAKGRTLLPLVTGSDGAGCGCEELHRWFHSLKGTSASFGIQDLAAVAGRGEELLKGALGGGGGVSGEVASVLEEILAALDLLVDPGRLAAMVGEGGGWRQEVMVVAEAPGRSQPVAGEGLAKVVYVCDDEAERMGPLVDQLACFGYECRLFAKPQALLQAAAVRVPDAVVLDMVFPCSMSRGAVLLDELRERYGDGIAAVFFSGRSDWESRRLAVQAGGGAYLVKPVKGIDLVEVLDGLVRPPAANPYRILIVDDELDVASLHAAILEDAGMVPRLLTRVDQVLEVLAEFKADLVLMDIYMPECSGQELARVIRQIPEFISLPIVYLSGETDVWKQYAAQLVGADGFLVKPIEPWQLISSVVVRAERMRVLRSLMVRDSLTGLLNHTAIKQALDSTLHLARRDGGEVCFAMIDVDRFKLVNDTYGHPMGDQVLVALARLLQKRLRNSDLVGRYGGEEFAVVLPNTPPEQGERILQQLREDFATLRFVTCDQEFSCTFSCGMSSFPGVEEVAMICQVADQALYEAKHTGRNRLVVAAKGDARCSSGRGS